MVRYLAFVILLTLPVFASANLVFNGGFEINDGEQPWCVGWGNPRCAGTIGINPSEKGWRASQGSAGINLTTFDRPAYEDSAFATLVGVEDSYSARNVLGFPGPPSNQFDQIYSSYIPVSSLGVYTLSWSQARSDIYGADYNGSLIVGVFDVDEFITSPWVMLQPFNYGVDVFEWERNTMNIGIPLGTELVSIVFAVNVTDRGVGFNEGMIGAVAVDGVYFAGAPVDIPASAGMLVGALIALAFIGRHSGLRFTSS